MKLQQKLFLAFLFIIIIPIALLGMILIELIITHSNENISQVVKHELAMVLTQYQQQGEAVKQGLEQVAGSPDMQRAISQRDPAYLRRLVASWQSVHVQIDLWLIADQDGYISAQFPHNLSDTFVSPPFNHLLQTTLTTGQSLISTERLIDPKTGQSHLVQLVLVPVILGPATLDCPVEQPYCQAKPICAILAIDRLDNNRWPLPPQMGLSYGETGENASPLTPIIFITTHDEIVATSSTDLSRSQLFSSDIQEAIQMTVNTNWAFQGQGKVSDQTYQLAGRPIVNSEQQTIGSLFAALPYRKYFGLQAKTGWIVTTMLILGGIISLITASLIASAITQPILNLIEKSGLLANGDLSVRASVFGKDEIAQLGQAFNDMAANLEQSYEVIEQERRRALAIIEASADGIWVVNTEANGEHQVTIANSALAKMTGHSQSTLVGQPCHGLMDVCTLEGDSMCATACPFNHPDQKTTMVHGLLSDIGGDETPVEISHGRLLDRAGELTGVVHIMRDLTLRREVERLKADFISMVSHELRTPLGHIKGFASTLLQTDVSWDTETQRDFLGSIDQEVDRLTKLVENLLQMSRIEAGGLNDMERLPHTVDDLLDSALPELRQRASRHRLVIDRSPAICSSLVLVNARRIELVLTNLVDNAAKYAPPRTTITLTINLEADQVIFQVIDEGPGIALQEQAHIFDRFYRVKTTRRRVGGTGLGLAICRQLVEAHDGHIWVVSRPNQGATFSFSLPLVKTKEVAYV